MGGDQTKMREALETMINLFEQGIICTSYANSVEEMEQIEELYCKAKAALSAPERNCDRFGGNYVMLHTAWCDWIGSPSGHLLDGSAKTLTFAAWLLATAAERKGENDGK